MNITNLVGIHEAGVAHHVTAVGEIDSEDCAAAELDVRGPVLMHVRIFGCLKVTAKKERLDPFEKRRIGGHHINKLAMFRTGLAHDDLAVLFHNLCFDFSRMFIHQRLKWRRAVDDRGTNLLNTARTKGIGFSRKAERRRRAFVGFQERAGRPLRPHRLAFGQALVDGLKSFPGDVRERRNQLGTSRSAQFGLICLAATKLIAKQ